MKRTLLVAATFVCVIGIIITLTLLRRSQRSIAISEFDLFVTIDPVSGLVRELGRTKNRVSGLDFNADSTLFGGVAVQPDHSEFAPGALVMLDQSEGSVTLIGDPTSNPEAGLTSIAFDTSGALFATETTARGPASPTQLIQIDPQTGALVSAIGTTRTSDGDLVKISDLATQPGSGTIFGISSALVFDQADPDMESVKLYTIDTETALVTLIGDTGGVHAGGLAFAPDGTLYQVTISNGIMLPTTGRVVSLITLDPTTGDRIKVLDLQSGDPARVPSLYAFDGFGIRGDGELFAAGKWFGNALRVEAANDP